MARAGRPRRSTTGAATAVTVKLTPEERAELQELSRLLGESQSDILRRGMVDARLRLGQHRAV